MVNRWPDIVVNFYFRQYFRYTGDFYQRDIVHLGRIFPAKTVQVGEYLLKNLVPGRAGYRLKQAFAAEFPVILVTCLGETVTIHKNLVVV